MKSLVPYTRYWWWLLLCALLGAGLVNSFLLLFPVQYRSQAQISITFDHNASLNWDDKTMLQLTEALAEVFYDPQILKTVVIAANEQGVQLSESELLQISRIEQRFYAWVLTVQAPSAQQAETILNIWLNTSFDVLQHEKELLAQVSAWKSKSALLVSCYQRLPVEPAHPICSYGNQSNIQSQIIQTHNQQTSLMEEMHFFPGFDPAFSIEITQLPFAAKPIRPELNSLLMVSGLLVGFCAGWFSLRFGYPTTLFTKKLDVHE